MTSVKMGEQPIFTCQAHVFHIDPKTKRTWITASMKAVAVSFFYDSSRNLYRIISVEGSKAVINSTITPNMTFTQTSQKFGQWSDVRANTVYGLGFASEAELTKFVEKFQEVKEATKNALAKSTANGSTAVTPITSANTSPVTSRTASSTAMQNDNSTINEVHHVDPPNLSNTNTQNANPDSPQHKIISTSNQSTNLNNSDLKQTSQSNEPINQTTNIHSGSGGGGGGPVNVVGGGGSVVGVGGVVGTGGDQQLKYENERLKMALAQSCANAKKWEIELATLKSNNIRLTSALQESTANVDEWKRQLHTYKEENIRLKREMDNLIQGVMGPGGQSGNGGEIADDLRREIGLLKGRIESLEKDLMNQEIELKTANLSLRDKCNDQSMMKLNELNVQFAKHLSELFSVQKDMDKVLHPTKST